MGTDIFLEHAGRGRNGWWRYVVAWITALALAAFALALIGMTLMLARLLPADLAADMLSPARPARFFGANGVVFGVLLVAFAVAFRLVQAKRFVDLLGRWSWRAFGAGAGMWAATICLLAALDFAIAPNGFRWTADDATLTLAAWAVVALAVQTFAEEYVFRGHLTQGLLLATRRPVVASVISGLLFGLMHIPNGAAQAASALVTGVMLSLVAIRTGGLAFGWGLHLVNNLFGAVVIVSGADVFRGSHGLITQTTPELLWFDAAMNAVAIAAVALIVIRSPPRRTVAEVRA